MTHLLGLDAQVQHEGLQAQALVADVNKAACKPCQAGPGQPASAATRSPVRAAVEGAEGQRWVHQVLLHGDGQLLQHLRRLAVCSTGLSSWAPASTAAAPQTRCL